MAEEELTFPFEKWSLFRDLEVADRKVQLDPRSIRAAYLDEVRKHITLLEAECGKMNVEYVPMSTAQDFDVALATYLARRRSLAK